MIILRAAALHPSIPFTLKYSSVSTTHHTQSLTIRKYWSHTTANTLNRSPLSPTYHSPTLTVPHHPTPIPTTHQHTPPLSNTHSSPPPSTNPHHSPTHSLSNTHHSQTLTTFQKSWLSTSYHYSHVFTCHNLPLSNNYSSTPLTNLYHLLHFTTHPQYSTALSNIHHATYSPRVRTLKYSLFSTTHLSPLVTTFKYSPLSTTNHHSSDNTLHQFHSLYYPHVITLKCYSPLSTVCNLYYSTLTTIHESPLVMTTSCYSPPITRLHHSHLGCLISFEPKFRCQ